jgi:hypothetical protein
MLGLLPLLGAVFLSCAPPDPVEEIVARHLAARGGRERIQALQSVRATGTARGSGGRVARVVRESKRPGSIRLEFDFQGVSSIYAHDGTRGWQVTPLQGRFEPEPLPPEVAAVAVDQVDIEGPLLDWRAKGHTVTLLGRETVGGREAFQLEEKLSSGEVRVDFIDTGTYLLARTDVARTVGGRRVWLETTFSDYRVVEGLQFPHAIESRARNRPQSVKIRIETIELDPVLDDAIFRMPE